MEKDATFVAAQRRAARATEPALAGFGTAARLHLGHPGRRGRHGRGAPGRSHQPVDGHAGRPGAGADPPALADASNAPGYLLTAGTPALRDAIAAWVARPAARASTAWVCCRRSAPRAGGLAAHAARARPR
ncbi:hypothetical protein V2I01_07855 [Micromonospora sp. BRA006-A]|nr:hypothetical protein [Micromonospora sp. BRA006-A]